MTANAQARGTVRLLPPEEIQQHDHDGSSDRHCEETVTPPPSYTAIAQQMFLDENEEESDVVHPDAESENNDDNHTIQPPYTSSPPRDDIIITLSRKTVLFGSAVAFTISVATLVISIYTGSEVPTTFLIVVASAAMAIIHRTYAR